MAEVLNAIVKNRVEIGLVKGICLPGGNIQQVLAQFADDTSFTLLGEKRLAIALVAILDSFCLASDLVLNRGKSCGY